MVLPLDLLQYETHQAAVEKVIAHFGKVCKCMCVRRWDMERYARVCVCVCVCVCVHVKL